jgi:hypothetical protein
MTFNPILSGIVYEEQQNNSKPFWNPAIRMNLHLQYLNINLDEVTLCTYYQLWHPACYSCYTPGIKSLMRKGRVVITTNGTCPWSFVIQILRIDLPSHD